MKLWFQCHKSSYIFSFCSFRFFRSDSCRSWTCSRRTAWGWRSANPSWRSSSSKSSLKSWDYWELWQKRWCFVLMFYSVLWPLDTRWSSPETRWSSTPCCTSARPCTTLSSRVFVCVCYTDVCYFHICDLKSLFQLCSCGSAFIFLFVLKCSYSRRREKIFGSADHRLHPHGEIITSIILCQQQSQLLFRPLVLHCFDLHLLFLFQFWGYFFFFSALQVSFGRDFEQQLSFCVEARATFCNLEPVLVQLIHVSLCLAFQH